MYKVFTFPTYSAKTPILFKWKWAALVCGWYLSWWGLQIRVESSDGEFIWTRWR